MSNTESQTSTIALGVVLFVIIISISAALLNLGFQLMDVDATFFGLASVLVGLRFAIFGILGK